jgi:hypothetical protein
MSPANENEEGLPGAPPLRRELVGQIWMDSGQLVLTDPDYLPDLDGEALARLTSLRQRFAVFNEGQAMVFRSGIRNASYPVYVTRFENGAIARIEIELAEQI